MSVDKKPEELMLEELRRSYQNGFENTPLTPFERTNTAIKATSEILRQRHLEIELQIQNSLNMSTVKMGMAQTLQKIDFMVDELSALMEGGEESFSSHKNSISTLVDNLATDLEKTRTCTANEIMASLVSSVSSLAQSNTALLQARDLDLVHTHVRSMKQILAAQASANKQVH